VTATLEDRCPAIRARVGIGELLAAHGHEPARTTGDTSYYHCPLPGHEDREPSFTVKGERWKCWSQCDASGDVIDLVVLLQACSHREAIDALSARAGLMRDKQPAPRTGLSPERSATLLADFLNVRQWDAGAAAEAGLHVVLDRYGHPRVRFPYRYGEETVWWQDRAIGDAQPKWLSPPGKRPAVYHARALQLAHERDDELWLVEGPSDVMALLSTFQAPAVIGIPGAGNFSPDWVPAFHGLREVVVCGDNDGAGLKFRERVAQLLARAVLTVVQLHVPEPYNDLDDWRRGCGTAVPELFGESLERAATAAEEAGR